MSNGSNAEGEVAPLQRAALAHPDRRLILQALHRDGEKMSARDIAGSGLLTSPLSGVSYHLNTLADAELIERVESVPDGPSRRAYYVSALADDSPLLSLLPD